MTGVCLAIASFNRSSSAIRREFQPIINSKLRDRDFWLLLKSKAAGDPQFKAENLRYVPRFFAAAIIGENPRSFKLPMLPLSSYSEVPAIKPIPPDQLEKAAVKVIRDISNDESYSFSPQVLQELASEVEFQRYHATGLRTMRNEFRNMDQTKLLEEAQKQGIKPNLLVYATIADEVFGSSRIYSADYVLRHLVQLQAHFGSQFADAILLTLAAYKIPGEDNRSHPLLADLRRLVQNPQTDRNIWFLHEQGAISLEAYDFVLRFLAIGIIAQEMNS